MLFGTGTFRRFSDQIVASGCFFSRQRDVFKSRLRILDLGATFYREKKHSRLKSGIARDYFGGKKKLSREHFRRAFFAVRCPRASLRSPLLSSSPFPRNEWGIMGKCPANRNVYAMFRYLPDGPHPSLGYASYLHFMLYMFRLLFGDNFLASIATIFIGYDAYPIPG